MPFPDMPIFLNPNRYVNVPLEATYLEAWKGMPGFWRDVVVGNPAGCTKKLILWRLRRRRKMPTKAGETALRLWLVWYTIPV